MYKLVFQDCVHISSERLFSCNDFIYGVFIDSAILRKIQYKSDSKNQGKKYYLYRIVFDDGFLDLIFSRFRIRKLTGRIQYPDFSLIEDYPKYRLIQTRDGDLLNESEKLDVDWVQKLVESGYSEERCYALIYLIMNEGLTMIDIARRIMKLDWWEYEEARNAAIWAIGIQGNENDIPMLFDEYFGIDNFLFRKRIGMCSSLLPKRHVMDAIEMIKYRMELAGSSRFSSPGTPAHTPHPSPPNTP